MKFKGEKILDIPEDELRNIVLDVDKYSEFAPFCTDSRILLRRESGFDARLSIGFGPIRESFTSSVECDTNGNITFRYLDGPLKTLRGQWTFTNVSGKTHVLLELDFEFANHTLGSVAKHIFSAVSDRMIGAFEKRAQQVYNRKIMQKRFMEKRNV